MSRIADQHDAGTGVGRVTPGLTMHRAERAGRLVAELTPEFGHQRQRVGEMLGEKVVDTAGIDRIEARSSRVRQEQRSGEATIEVGQGDQHEAAAWPYVEAVGGERVVAVGAGWNRQLAVAVIEQILAGRDQARGGHGSPDHGSRTVGSQQQARRDRQLARRRAQRRNGALGIEIDATVLEAIVDAEAVARRRQKCQIQLVPRDRPDALVVLRAVGKKPFPPVALVDDAPAHR